MYAFLRHSREAVAVLLTLWLFFASAALAQQFGHPQYDALGIGVPAPPFPPSGVAGDFSGGSVTATGSSTPRTLGARAIDVGNVLDFGAACNGTTDDTVAIQNALNAAKRVIIPAGANCYSASGVTVPAGVTLAGLTFDPSAQDASRITCAANIAYCVRIYDATGNAGSLQNLTVTTSASSAPTTGVCLLIYHVRQVTIHSVLAYNCYDGIYVQGGGGGAGGPGIGARFVDFYTGNISHVHVTQDTWPELYMTSGRMGIQAGSYTSEAYFKITGGSTTNAAGGPNGLILSQVQMNDQAVQYGLEFLNCTAGTANCLSNSLWMISNSYISSLATAFIRSDSTWPSIVDLQIANASFGTACCAFFALDPATGLQASTITGSWIAASSFTVAPTSRQVGLTMAGNTMQATPISITGGSSNNSLLSLIGNINMGAVTISGVYNTLNITGGSASSINISGATWPGNVMRYSTVGGPYTWTPPAGYRLVKLRGCGWGGPGGSGAVQASTAGASGGGSGAAGFCRDDIHLMSELSGGVTVTIGAAPVPGAAVTASVASPVKGNAGVQGGETDVFATGGSTLTPTRFYPGGAGSGGQLAATSGGGSSAGACNHGTDATAVGNPGTSVCGGTSNGGGAGAAGTPATAGTGIGAGGSGTSAVGVAGNGAATVGPFNAASGGAGGGVTAAGAANNGGAGATTSFINAGATAGTSSTPNGGNAVTGANDLPGPGGGGGWGGPVTTAVAGNGGNGSQGDGGGGGGACTATSGNCTSGAGGQGGSAFVELIPIQ